MMKKGQLTVNTIIVAALAVTVLIVLFAIFTGRIRVLPEETAKTEAKVRAATCSAQNGYCVSSEEECPEEGYERKSAPLQGWLDCPNAKTDLCCRPTPVEE
ncbi:hypothetical protein HYV79_01080 [Candidatus Woesearchaeota archaeon]|nr:hypothetical protein [Candidatus Woesearchaeota archaeon]